MSGAVTRYRHAIEKNYVLMMALHLIHRSSFGNYLLTNSSSLGIIFYSRTNVYNSKTIDIIATLRETKKQMSI